MPTSSASANQAIHARATEIGEGSGGVFLTDDGVLVLQIIDDLEPCREALAVGSGLHAVFA